MSIALFHISGWAALTRAGVGDSFVLRPGSQHAEGPGVYFSEHVPVVVTTAEGSRGGVAAVVEIEVDDARGWWRTKRALARKFGRPVTWHTDGKSIRCIVVDVVRKTASPPLLRCAWSFVAERHGLSSGRAPARRLQYVGQCDRVRRRVGGESFWKEMMKNAREVSFGKLLERVDMTPLLDEGETPREWFRNALESDPNAYAAKSRVAGRPVYFIATAGFEFIFAER